MARPSLPGLRHPHHTRNQGRNDTPTTRPTIFWQWVGWPGKMPCIRPIQEARKVMRDTSHIGEICRTQVIAARTLLGKAVLVPLGDHRRYDLGIDEDEKF